MPNNTMTHIGLPALTTGLATLVYIILVDGGSLFDTPTATPPPPHHHRRRLPLAGSSSGTIARGCVVLCSECQQTDVGGCRTRPGSCWSSIQFCSLCYLFTLNVQTVITPISNCSLVMLPSHTMSNRSRLFRDISIQIRKQRSRLCR